MTNRFVMEAWPTGTRERALRHALRYRREAHYWEGRAGVWIDSALALLGRNARLEAQLAAALRHLDAGDLGSARRVLEGGKA